MRSAMGLSCRPCGMRLPPPLAARTGSTRPQTVVPSPTARLSPVARAPDSSSCRKRVERPIPLAALTSGVDVPFAHAEACRGARPRIPAHQSAGYCIRTALASKWNRERSTQAAARSRAGGRHR